MRSGVVARYCAVQYNLRQRDLPRINTRRWLQFLFQSCIMVLHWLLRKLYTRPFLCDFLLRSTFSWENDFQVEFSHFKERKPSWKWVFHYDPGHAPLLRIWKKYDVFFDVIRNICFWTGWHLNGMVYKRRIESFTSPFAPEKVHQKFWKNCHRWAPIVTKICSSFKKIGPIGAKIQDFKD